MPIRRSNLLAFYGIKEFVRESNAFRGFLFWFGFYLLLLCFKCVEKYEVVLCGF